MEAEQRRRDRQLMRVQQDNLQRVLQRQRARQHRKEVSWIVAAFTIGARLYYEKLQDRGWSWDSIHLYFLLQRITLPCHPQRVRRQHRADQTHHRHLVRQWQRRQCGQGRKLRAVVHWCPRWPRSTHTHTRANKYAKNTVL